jgi:hypothetical protein
MSDDEFEEAFQRFATPRGKLMREAGELIAAGDAEILAARADCVAAMQHYRSVNAVYESTEAIQDVSWFEVHAALMQEVAADLTAEAAVDTMLAIVARRRRLALQQQREEGRGSG